MVKRTSFDSWPCSIARTVDVLGDAWTLLILREVFYGESRFDGFVQSLRIARNTLSDRLAALVDTGILEKRAYQTDPLRHEYLLTEPGRDLFGVIAAINAWGDRWLAGPDGKPVTLNHYGHELTAHVTCGDCSRLVDYDHVSIRMGPGYPTKLAQDPDIRSRFARTIDHTASD